MNTNWRWIVSLLIFLSIPSVGTWQYVKHWQILNSERQVTLSDLEEQTAEELQQIQLSGFRTEDVKIVETNNHEYAVVISVEKEEPSHPKVAVVLEHKKSGSIPLESLISTGVVTGLVSTNQSISKKRADKLGLDLSYSPAEHFLVVDIEREYLTEIVGITVGFLLIGLIGLTIVYANVDGQQFKDKLARDRVKSQVFLQLNIAKQETYRSGL